MMLSITFKTLNLHPLKENPVIYMKTNDQSTCSKTAINCPFPVNNRNIYKLMQPSQFTEQNKAVKSRRIFPLMLNTSRRHAGNQRNLEHTVLSLIHLPLTNHFTETNPTTASGSIVCVKFQNS